MAKEKKQFEGVKFTTPVFRASFLTVFEPRAFEDGEPKYSVEMLFHETKSDLTDFKKKLYQVAESAWGKDTKLWPKNFRFPFKKGDDKDDAGEAYAGHLYARADSKRQPGIYDQEKNDIISKNEFVSGDYARASLFMVPYENIGGKGPDGRSGIKLYLQGIQLYKKGEPLGAAGSSRNDFDEVKNEDQTDSDDETDFGF